MKISKIFAAVISGAMALSVMAMSASADDSISIKLYAQDTSEWVLCEGDAVTINGDGSYSVSADLKGYDLFATLYMKDTSEKKAPESYANATVTIDSIVLNDSINLELSKTEFEALNKDTSIFDVCFVNQWADTFVTNVENNGGSFNYIDGGKVVSVNKATVNFTISGMGGGSAADTTAEAPAADTATTSAKTGNTGASIIVTVMALAGTAAITAKKRK